MSRAITLSVLPRDHFYKGTLESFVLSWLWPSDIVACFVSDRFFASVEEKKLTLPTRKRFLYGSYSQRIFMSVHVDRQEYIYVEYNISYGTFDKDSSRTIPTCDVLSMYLYIIQLHFCRQVDCDFISSTMSWVISFTELNSHYFGNSLF